MGPLYETNIPNAPPPLDPASPPSVLYVPDGTYKQARRMLRRVPALVDLPRVEVAAALDDSA